jgi:uncharacterized zinc-type alcohol dehydrogenase-like protein
MRKRFVPSFSFIFLFLFAKEEGGNAMSPVKIMGYAAKEVGGRLEPFEFTPPELNEEEVRVAVSHCGVCHTDIQGIDNYYGIVSYPFIPGHEIVGHVSETGKAMRGLKEGDRVGIGWQGRSCGECEWCLKGETQLCMKIEETGTWTPYGGFSPSVCVDQRFAHPLPAGMPAETAAVLMCAGITVYAALRNHVQQPGQKVGIAGVGGLGHLAIQFAKAMGCEVTALSTSPGKKEQALKFGAAHFLDVGDRDAYRQAYFSLDMLLCTANEGINWDVVINVIKKRGKLVLVGFPDLKFNSTDMVAHELSLTASFLGNPATMREMLDFAQAHGITPMVEVMPMRQVNEALQKVKENKARYRIVLVNE